MKSLSILIPEYNEDCVGQVSMLCRQCEKIPGLLWEIVVADDGSSAHWQKINSVINNMAHCRFVTRNANYGRSSNRNFLAREAKYDWLLYIDAGLAPAPLFVEKYVENIGRSLVVCGNIEVSPEHADMTSLRCLNEMKAQKRFTAEKHARKPYKNFHSGNFMVDRNTILANPFREDIKTYGYEDTLFGKNLADKHITISHIYNPILFTRFESNERFLEKTKEGIGTLYSHRHELEGYSPLLHLVTRLRRYHLSWPLHIIYKCFGKLMEGNLKSRNPSLRIFSLYRLCLLAEKA